MHGTQLQKKKSECGITINLVFIAAHLTTPSVTQIIVYTVTKRQQVMNCKWCRRKFTWHNLRYLPPGIDKCKKSQSKYSVFQSRFVSGTSRT